MCKVLCFIRKIYVILYILVSHHPPEDLSVFMCRPSWSSVEITNHSRNEVVTAFYYAEMIVE